MYLELILFVASLFVFRAVMFWFGKARTGGNKVMVVLGSGGHTGEMLAALGQLDAAAWKLKSVVYVVSETDKDSKGAAEVFEREFVGRASRSVTIPRAREVGQSYFTSIFTTLYAMMISLLTCFDEQPDIVLVNGPGVCVPIIFSALWIALLLGQKRPALLYLESFTCVNHLSVSGKILRPIVDVFGVQWKEMLGILCRGPGNSKKCRNVIFTGPLKDDEDGEMTKPDNFDLECSNSSSEMLPMLLPNGFHDHSAPIRLLKPAAATSTTTTSASETNKKGSPSGSSTSTGSAAAGGKANPPRSTKVAMVATEVPSIKDTLDPLCLVTVGSTKFDALMAAIDTTEFYEELVALGIRRLLIQKGRSSFEFSSSPSAAPATAGDTAATTTGGESSSGAAGQHRKVKFPHLLLSRTIVEYKPNLKQDIRQASLLISHAGAGTILEALSNHVPTIVVPNDALMSNHQLQLATALASNKFLFCCMAPRLVPTIKDANWGNLRVFPDANVEAIREAFSKVL